MKGNSHTANNSPAVYKYAYGIIYHHIKCVRYFSIYIILKLAPYFYIFSRSEVKEKGMKIIVSTIKSKKNIFRCLHKSASKAIIVLNPNKIETIAVTQEQKQVTLLDIWA